MAGKCPGVKYPPFQLSNEGTYAYIEQLKLTLAELEDYLQTLHDPMLVAFCDVLGHARTKAGMDEQWWARSLAELVKHKEWQAGGLTKNIDHLCTVAEAWVRAPLPGGST